MDRKVDEHITRDAAFLLSNKKGNFLSFGKDNFSHMQGLFFFDKDKWMPYKTIEDIRLNAEATVLKNNFFSTERHYKGGAEESFSLFNNSMIYSVWNYTGELTLELDFRHIFDFDDKGRIYSVFREEDLIIVRYDKYSDNSLATLERTRFMAIKGASGFKQTNQWIKKDYAFDANRHSRSEFYVYRGLTLEVKGAAELVFSFSQNKEEAKSHASQIYDNLEYVRNSMKKYAYHTFSSNDLSLSAAMKALDDLIISADFGGRSVGIFAGLPWFFQFWSRDELISLKALLLQEKYPLVKSILFRYLQSIEEDGLLPNRLPASSIKSIDSAGWLFFRANEFLKELVKSGTLNDYLSLTDLMSIKKALEKSIQGLVQHHSKDGLIVCSSQESWMDTKEARREGACIEIQALFLSMLRMHNEFAKLMRSKPVYKSLEKEFASKVRSSFFINGELLDCVGGELSEDSARPNLFLAYYAYPDLLSAKEWKMSFDKAIQKLWLDWGGFSTLSQTHQLFKQEYDGENDTSYHNGDSWYYVNNYAAIAMHRLDKEYYSKYINRILYASREDLLFSGFIGCGSELSSAKHHKSEGCLSQAWSNASFIELMHELGKD
jgi:glycogen debranching enzyme